MNVGNSKVMRCTRKEVGARLNVMLNGEALEEVDQFKYLGSVIAANGGEEADTCHRVNEGCKVLGALKGVMKNRGLGMNVKKVLYEKVVMPTVMYDSESWGMTVTERQKLNMFEMKCLRIMTGVSWLDRVRNEVARARTGVRRELAARVDTYVLRWFGHVERMDNERLLKKVMNAKVDGRSARDRPRFRWMDGVKSALNDRRMDVREGSEHARNRNDWRTIVTQFSLAPAAATGLPYGGNPVVGAAGEMASVKQRKSWKTGEDGLCCSSSAIQTRLGPSSLLEERSKTPIVFVVFFVLSATPKIGGNGQGIYNIYQYKKKYNRKI